jgi:hypothetical protein
MTRHFKVTVRYESEVLDINPDSGVEEPIWKETFETYSTWVESVDDACKEAEEHGYYVIDCCTFKHWEENQAWLVLNPVPF